MLNLHQIQLFITIVKEGSFSAAAKLLHMSQPAVSAQLKNLEETLGVQLLNRQGRQLMLTPAGFLVYEHGKEILEKAKQLLQELNVYSQKCEEQILLGASTLVADFPLPCALYVFKEKYPQYCVKVRRERAAEIVKLLADGELELALLEGATTYPGWTNYACGQDELLVAVPAEHLLAGTAQVTAQDLERAVFLTGERNSGLRSAIDYYLQQLGLSVEALPKTLELNSIAAIKSALEAGMGISILPRSVMRREIRTKTVKALPLEGRNMPLYFYLLTKEQAKLTPGVKLLLNFLSDPAQRVFC